jgi:hypothetical protein
MISISNPSNNGNSIVIRYNTATSVAIFSSFADINDKEGTPPSKFAPLDADAVGGLYDHVFGFIRDSFTATNRWLSIEAIKPTATPWWTNFGQPIAAAVYAEFGGDFIWLVLTEMEYVDLEPVTTVKVTMHFGVDVYMV